MYDKRRFVPGFVLWPRLACMLCLQGKYGEVLLMLGTVCSTWVAVNRATSGRSYVTPCGNLQYDSVQAANRMVSRTLCKNAVCLRFVVQRVLRKYLGLEF